MTVLETPLLRFVIIGLNLELNKQTSGTNAWFDETIHGIDMNTPVLCFSYFTVMWKVESHVIFEQVSFAKLLRPHLYKESKLGFIIWSISKWYCLDDIIMAY